MSERDPRNNPAVGDVVEKGGISREVTEVKNNNIVYLWRKGSSSRISTCWISTWQGWCSKATVVKKAEVSA